MLIHLQTFDGHNINDGINYRAALLNPRNMPNAKAVFLEQTNAESLDSDVYTLDVVNRVISVHILNHASRYALSSQLKGWFLPGARAYLTGIFSDDGVEYQIECRVVNITQDPDYPLHWNVVLQSPASSWTSVAAQTDTWTVTSAGGNKTITVGGDGETRLIAEFTGTVAPGGGYVKQNIYQLVNVPKFALGLRPWCITVNTATLVAAGKMRSDCFDLRIFDGVTELRRWIAGPNTATTKIWFNLDIREGYQLKLKTAINNSQTVTALEFVVDATHKALIAAMPNAGIIVHGTEWFAYSGRDAVNCKLTITSRGAYGTTKQAHIVNDVFSYIQHPIFMVYGYPSATDPSLDDDAYDDSKPIFNLSSSDNTQWVYDATTKFYDASAPSRTGQWTVTEKKLGDVSKIYYIKGDASSGDPATGLQAGVYNSGGVAKSDTTELAFMLAVPCGAVSVTATGRKYRNSAKWFTYNGFQHSANGTAWTTLWTEATPAALTTWENWAAHSAVAVPNTARYIRHAVTGTYPLLASSYALTEGLTVTVPFITANLPTGTLLGEVSNFYFDFTLTNGANDDSLKLRYPALYNIIFKLDAEHSEAYYGTVNAHRAIQLDDESRDIWMRLAAGSNTLTISSADVGTLDVALSWYRRRLG